MSDLKVPDQLPDRTEALRYVPRRKDEGPS